MKAEIVVTTTYRFKIDAEDYDSEIGTWQQALDSDIATSTYEEFDDSFVTVEGKLLGDDQEPWPKSAIE